MVGRTEQLRVKALLTEAITVLCKNGLRYRNQFSVEGLLGITLDNDDVFLVNINETIGEPVQEDPPAPVKSPPIHRVAARDAGNNVREETSSPRRRRKRSHNSPESSPAVKKWQVESDSADEDSRLKVITIKEESLSDDESLQADLSAQAAMLQSGAVTHYPNMSGEAQLNMSTATSVAQDSSFSDSMLSEQSFSQQDAFQQLDLQQTMNLPGALKDGSLALPINMGGTLAGCSNWDGTAMPLPQISGDVSQGQVLGLSGAEERVVAHYILGIEGCFVMTRVVRRRYQRYSSQQIRGIMQKMMRPPGDPLYVGQLKYLPKQVQVFYKCPPKDITDAALKHYNLTREKYTAKYFESARPSKSGPFDWKSYYSMVSGFAPHPLPPLSEKDLVPAPPKRPADKRPLPFMSMAMLNMMAQSPWGSIGQNQGMVPGGLLNPMMPDMSAASLGDNEEGDQTEMEDQTEDWAPDKKEEP